MRRPAVFLPILCAFALACGTRGSERTAEQPAPWPDVPERCQEDLGCPDQKDIAPCPPDRAGVSIDDAVQGQTVTVAARLVQDPSITMMMCDPKERCCNGAGGEAHLELGRKRVALIDPEAPRGYFCSGDDTLVCCPFSPREPVDVLATGTVVEFDPPSAGSGAAFGLERPEICLAPVAAASEPSPSASTEMF